MVWSKHVANYIKVQVVFSHAKTCLETRQSFSEKKLQYLGIKWNNYAFYGDPATILVRYGVERPEGLTRLLQLLRCQREHARQCILTKDDQQPTFPFTKRCFRLLRQWLTSAPSGHVDRLLKMNEDIVAEFHRIDHGQSTDHERALYITYLEGIKTFDSEKGYSLRHHSKILSTEKVRSIDSYSQARWQHTGLRAVTDPGDTRKKTKLVVPKNIYSDVLDDGQNRKEATKTVTTLNESLIRIDTWLKELNIVDDEQKIIVRLDSFTKEQSKRLLKSVNDGFENGKLIGLSSQPELFATLSQICCDSCTTINEIKEHFIAKLKEDMALKRARIRQNGQERLHKLQVMSLFEEDVHHFEADIDEQRKDAMAKIGLEIDRSHPSPDCHKEKEK